MGMRAGEVSREQLAALATAIDAWLDTCNDRTFQLQWDSTGFRVNHEEV